MVPPVSCLRLRKNRILIPSMKRCPCKQNSFSPAGEQSDNQNTHADRRICSDFVATGENQHEHHLRNPRSTRPR